MEDNDVKTRGRDRPQKDVSLWIQLTINVLAYEGSIIVRVVKGLRGDVGGEGDEQVVSVIHFEALEGREASLALVG